MTTLETRYLSEAQEWEMLAWVSDQTTVESVSVVILPVVPDHLPFNKGSRWKVTFADDADETVFFLMKWC